MRDVEHESLQNESSVEMIAIPAEKKHPISRGLPSKTLPERTTSRDSTRRSGAWRFILIGGALCLIAAILVISLALLRPQPSQQASHFENPPAAPPVPDSTALSLSVSTDSSTNVTVVNGVVYASSGNGEVYALRSSNGSVLWRQSINAGANGAPLVLASNGIVYVLAETTDIGPGTLYALRTSDGAQLWRYHTNDYLSALTIANGIAYATTYDDVSDSGRIIALRANDGAQLWHSAADGSSYEAPIVENGVVYTTATRNNGSGTIYALRASDGVQLWHKTSNTFFSILMGDNGILYISTAQGIAALQASNGQQLWSDALNGNIASPLLFNGVLYFTSTKVSMETSDVSMSQMHPLSQIGAAGNVPHETLPMSFMKQAIPLKEGLSSVYAVRASDGAMLWHYQMSKAYGNNWANWLTLDHGTVYVGTFVNQDTSYIYALRGSDGSQLWRQTINQGMAANALVANGVIYLASFVNNGTVYAGSGALYALRASDGARLWYHAINWVVYNPPILVGTTLYVTTAADDVYAFHASNGAQMWHVYMNNQ